MPVMTGKFRRMACTPSGDGYECVCECGFRTTSRHVNAAHGCRDLFGLVPGEDPPGKPPTTFGPGTELKKLLAKIGIAATPAGCKCNQRARYMDTMEAQEPGWCEANLDEIVGWLRESASDRGLPFLDAAGRLLVRRAIANARRAAAS